VYFDNSPVCHDSDLKPTNFFKRICPTS